MRPLGQSGHGPLGRRSQAAAMALPCVLVLSLLLLLAGLGWGLPRAVEPGTLGTWATDEIAPVQPLAEAWCLFTRTCSPYLAYPIFHHIVLTAAFSPYLLFQLLSGHLEPSSTFPYGMQNPLATCRHLVLIGRLVSVLMAVGIVLLVYDLSRLLFNRRAALWSAAMTAVLPTFVYYGKTSNLDLPYTFWVVMACWCVSKIVLAGKGTTHYVLFGVSSSLAVCTKDQALGYVFLLPVVLAGFRYTTSRADSALKRVASSLLSREMFLGFCAAVVAFVLANNLVTGFHGFLRHVEEAVRMNVGNRVFSTDLQGQWQLLERCVGLLLTILGPAAALVLLGLACCLRSRRWAVLGLLVLPVLGHHLLILARFGWVYPRFLLATSVFLVILAGAAIDFFRQGLPARLVQGTAVLSLLYGLLFSASLDYALRHDARYAAEGWIRRTIPNRSRFEAYDSSKRYLPRVWDRHEIELVGTPGMTREELIRRNPDYIIVTSLCKAAHPRDVALGSFLEDLLAGRSGYRVLEEFETPTLRIFPVRMIFGVAPRVTILGPKKEPLKEAS